MADGLQMGNLSLDDSQHAPQANGGPPGRAAYIPPHLRGRPGAGGDSAPPAGPGYGGPRYVPPYLGDVFSVFRKPTR